VNLSLVEQYRERARAERASAAALNGSTAAQAARDLANSFDRVADAYESLLASRQDNNLLPVEAPASALR
jgi:hypothetical protein